MKPKEALVYVATVIVGIGIFLGAMSPVLGTPFNIIGFLMAFPIALVLGGYMIYRMCKE